MVSLQQAHVAPRTATLVQAAESVPRGQSLLRTRLTEALLRCLEPINIYEVRITAAYEEDARPVMEPSPVGPPAPLAPPTGGASGGGRIETGERGARSPEGGCAGPRG